MFSMEAMTTVHRHLTVALLQTPNASERYTMIQEVPLSHCIVAEHDILGIGLDLIDVSFLSFCLVSVLICEMCMSCFGPLFGMFRLMPWCSERCSEVGKLPWVGFLIGSLTELLPG